MRTPKYIKDLGVVEPIEMPKVVVTIDPRKHASKIGVCACGDDAFVGTIDDNGKFVNLCWQCSDRIDAAAR